MCSRRGRGYPAKSCMESRSEQRAELSTSWTWFPTEKKFMIPTVRSETHGHSNRACTFILRTLGFDCLPWDGLRPFSVGIEATGNRTSEGNKKWMWQGEEYWNLGIAQNPHWNSQGIICLLSTTILNLYPLAPKRPSLQARGEGTIAAQTSITMGGQIATGG